MANEFGERVRRLRLERGWTQRDLARRSNISHTAVSHLEQGIRSPKMQTALDIASALEVSLGELIGDPVAPLDEARLTPGHIGEVERDVEAMGEVEAQILEKARQLEAERTRIRRKGAAPRELQALWLDAFTSNEGLTNFVERTWGEEYRKTPRHARVRHALNRLDKALADMGDVVHKVRHDYESQPANVRHLEIPNQDTA